MTCQDLPPDFASGFTCYPSDLMTFFSVLSAYRGFSVSFIQPLSQPAPSSQGELFGACFSIDVFTLQDPCVSFVQPLLQPASLDPGEVITACVLVDVSAPALSAGVTRCVLECPYTQIAQLL